MKIVQIIWRDSNRYFDQVEANHDFEPEVITTAGYLVKMDDSAVVVCQDKVGKDYRGVIAIPVENIIDMLEVTGFKSKEL